MNKILFLPLLALLFGGCAAIEKANRENTERLLSAAGFQPNPANTASRRDSLASLAPYEVQRKLRGDEFYYVYADPEQNLVFIGDQKAYGKYQELLIQQEISNENMTAAQLNMSAAQQWNDWAFWGSPAAMLPPPRMRGGR
jgi:hypothetical protein